MANDSMSPAVNSAISPWLEMGAYEALWSEAKASFKRIADRFKAHPGALPSDFVRREVAEKVAGQVIDMFRAAKVERFGVSVHGAGEYPEALRKAEHPVELLYYQGWLNLLESPCVAVVGTREPTQEGVARTRKLVRSLVQNNFTVVSGLAAGIDTIAHRTAIEEGGTTIAVLGTPLSSVYPPENADLQQQIAKDFLLLSQVPALRYAMQKIYHNKFFFPARNVTMAALSTATIIVEAGQTSGTLTQARAALHQGKHLLILDSCFRDETLTWPTHFEQLGAVRVSSYEEIQHCLGTKVHQDRSA